MVRQKQAWRTLWAVVSGGEARRARAVFEGQSLHAIEFLNESEEKQTA
jgi:hypothetical protein